MSGEEDVVDVLFELALSVFLFVGVLVVVVPVLASLVRVLIEVFILVVWGTQCGSDSVTYWWHCRLIDAASQLV